MCITGHTESLSPAKKFSITTFIYEVNQQLEQATLLKEYKIRFVELHMASKSQ